MDCQLQLRIRHIILNLEKEFKEWRVMLKFITRCGCSKCQIWDATDGFPPERIRLPLPQDYEPMRHCEGERLSNLDLFTARVFQLHDQKTLNKKTKTIMFVYEEVTTNGK